MRQFIVLIVLSLFVGCSKDKNDVSSTVAETGDSLQVLTDSLDSISSSRKVGYTGQHMHGTSFGSKDPAKDAHQDVKKLYRLQKNLGRARARGREAHKKAEEARRELMRKQKISQSKDTHKDSIKE